MKANILSFIKGTVIGGLLLAAGFLGYNAEYSATADELPQPPSFPSCESKIGIDGDWSHSDSGFHHIPGQEVAIEGSDDVYFLTGANFLQCLCKKDSTNGIQTVWWNAENLSQSEIDAYKGIGWFLESGAAWNLIDKPYLAKNSEYVCPDGQGGADPTPTVTPTATPSPTASPSVSPSPTATLTPTVTPLPGPESRCFDLEAEPTEGTAPLTVKFTAHADDPVTGGKIKEYRFDFADASGGQPQVWFQTEPVAHHRYEIPGTYTAELRIQDNAGVWKTSDECRATIKVNAAPQVLGVKDTDKLPETGLPELVALTLLISGPLGIMLFKRFKLA